MKNKQHYSKLTKNIESENIVVGGGLAGAWCAYELASAGKEVVLLEANTIGSGATGDTTAFITQAIDTSLPSLVSMYGEATARRVWQSGQRAIDRIEEVIRKEQIDCEFMRCDAYLYATEEWQLEDLEEEVFLAQKLGFDIDFGSHDAGFKNYGYAVLRNQAKYSAEKFLSALIKKAKQRGAQIFEKTEISEISDGAHVIAKTESGKTVTGKNIIVATYDPFNHPKQTMLKKGFYFSYVINYRIRRGVLKEAIYFDKSSPYFYFRVDKRSKTLDSLTLGGADHKKMVPISKKKSFRALENHLKHILPELNHLTSSKWVGPILEPSDGLPLIGQYKPHHYLASAFSGNGMTYAALSGMIIRDQILGKSNPWTRLYDPDRGRDVKRYAHKAKEYADEFFGGAVKNILT